MDTSTIGAATIPIPNGLRDLTRSKAVKFLQRSTFGGRPEDVDHLMQIGIDAWFDEQLRANDRTTMLQRHQGDGTIWSAYWTGALSDSDQLRKRYTYAMSQIFVSSRASGAFRVAHYNDVLEDYCFGDFRMLLEAVSRSPAMIRFLTYHRNKKADERLGRVPDENYAREIMQLFTIGLNQLTRGGLPLLDEAGRNIPTYGPEDVAGLARVFTGIADDELNPDSRTGNLVPLDTPFARSFHETGEKTFLGTTIPAGTNLGESFAIAMDALTNHRNTPQFISKQLIARLVTSNPAGAYVRRVTEVFEDDGAGRRGNMAAVLRAILLDRHAWQEESEEFGKIREPVLRFTTAVRAFGVLSTEAKETFVNDLGDGRVGLGQQPWSSPSVFNFYRPGYVPPQTELANRGMVAPEMQIVNETSTIGWANFIADFLKRQPRVVLDYSDLTSLIENTEFLDEVQISALINELESRLCPDGLSEATRGLIARALQNSAPTNYTSSENVIMQTDLERVVGAATLVLASTDFLWER